MTSLEVGLTSGSAKRQGFPSSMLFGCQEPWDTECRKCETHMHAKIKP
jgi:hypothetical protein